MPQLVPEESLIRVLNLAKDPVRVTIQDQDLFQQPVEAFQVSINVGLVRPDLCPVEEKLGFFAGICP